MKKMTWVGVLSAGVLLLGCDGETPITDEADVTLTDTTTTGDTTAGDAVTDTSTPDTDEEVVEVCDLECAANQVCVNDACQCEDGFGDCDSELNNGCETPLDSLQHCGACGAGCQGQVNVENLRCEAGACTSDGCSEGYADCNKDPVDGCEINVLEDLSNCGACGVVCDNTQVQTDGLTCLEGLCTISVCVEGYEDCDAAADNTGCETTLGTLADCLTCDDACAEGQVCSGEGCVCDVGLDDCGGGPDCETNLLTDRDNCSACGVACVAGASCVEGVCSQPEEIVAGDLFSCARLSNGHVVCWGDHREGQLGAGDAVTDNSPVPVEVVTSTGPLTDVVALDAGSEHACALRSNGDIYCWGEGAAGEIGDDTIGDPGTKAQPGPTFTRIASRVVSTAFTGQPIAVSAGKDHTCALLDDGAIFCWGKGEQGQMGDGSNEAERLAPSDPVTWIDPDAPTALSAGFDYTCALVGGDHAYCWGSNAVGRLGDGTTTDRNTPVLSLDASASSELSLLNVSASSASTCAHIHYDPSDPFAQPVSFAKCWGSNITGGLGNGGSVLDKTYETTATLDADALIIDNQYGIEALFSSLDDTKCGLVLIPAGSGESPNIYCWGDNSGDVLTTGENFTAEPAIVDLLAIQIGNMIPDALALGNTHACLLERRSSERNAVYCWGSNSSGALGSGDVGGSELELARQVTGL